jgi:hypothetical protein
MKDARVVRPVFLVSSGRAGSTVFARLLSHHPSLAFLTQFNGRIPHRPAINRLAMQAMSVPVLESLVRKRIWCAEAYRFWAHYSPGFARPTRDLGARDVTSRDKDNLPPAIARNLTSSRHRFMAKVTGWSRIGFLKEVFPDACFVHILRDGREVAQSLLTVGFWDGWKGPSKWLLGELPTDLMEEWERYDRSFVILAAIFWKLTVGSVESASEGLDPDDFMEIRYEEFVADPVSALHSVVRFAGLPESRRFQRSVARMPLKSRDGKFRDNLTAQQQELLTSYLKPELERLGYL